MQEHDFERFSTLLLGVAENFGQTLSPEGMAFRFKALEQFTINDIEQATFSLLATRKYTTMPTIADFVEHISGGSAEDKAEVEAGKVLNAIKRQGKYKTVVFDNPVTQAVIERALGGWIKTCEDCGVEESEKWWRHSFVKTWAAYSRQNQKHYGALRGRIEQQNTFNGFMHAHQRTFIGDEAKAKEILKKGEEQQHALDMQKMPSLIMHCAEENNAKTALRECHNVTSGNR